MFTVKNGAIQGEKVFVLGYERKGKVSFYFEETEFSADDTFTLTIGTITSENFAFGFQGYVSFRQVDFTSIITQAIGNFSLTVKKGEETILSDTLTILADGVTVTPQDLQQAISNKLRIFETSNTNDIISLEYNSNVDIQRITNTGDTASITINPCSNYTAVSGKIPTFEMWIQNSVTKTTISISNQIELIGILPSELTAGKIHVFVWRFEGSKQTLNYSYSFEPEGE